MCFKLYKINIVFLFKIYFKQYICESISLLFMSKLKFTFLYILCSLILFLNFNCDNTTQSSEKIEQEVNTKENKVSAKDISTIKYTEFALSSLSEKATENWLKFNELQEELIILKKGDLSFFKDDKTILESLITDLKNEIPENLNINSILVRLSVLETTLFKLEGISSFNNVSKELLLNSIKDVLIANSNIILQMNKKFEKDSQNIQKPK